MHITYVRYAKSELEPKQRTTETHNQERKEFPFCIYIKVFIYL